MESLEERYIMKSYSHKYLRKIPMGNGKYRYIYKEPQHISRALKYEKNGWNNETTSKTEYANDANRKKLHEKTVAEYVKRSSRFGNTPTAVFTLGGSGAGKSTVLKMLSEKSDLYKNIVSVDSDDFKTKTFKEDFDFYNSQSAGSAAGRLHEESSELADEVVNGILGAGNDYLKDGTMKSFDKAIKEIKKAKDKGYHIKLVGVTIPVEEAIKRADIRAEKTGRKIKKDVIISAHTGSTKTFLGLIDSGLVDDLKLYDNTTMPPKLIYDSTLRNPIIDKQKFEEFKRKKDFVMEKDKVEKSVKFIPNESDKQFKKLIQTKFKGRNDVGYDLPNDADDEDLEITRQANEWLFDGKPVE